jgi:hypothetical protein
LQQAFKVRIRCDVPVVVGRMAGTAVLHATLLSRVRRNTHAQLLRHDTSHCRRSTLTHGHIQDCVGVQVFMAVLVQIMYM